MKISIESFIILRIETVKEVAFRFVGTESNIGTGLFRPHVDTVVIKELSISTRVNHLDLTVEEIRAIKGFLRLEGHHCNGNLAFKKGIDGFLTVKRALFYSHGSTQSPAGILARISNTPYLKEKLSCVEIAGAMMGCTMLNPSPFQHKAESFFFLHLHIRKIKKIIFALIIQDNYLLTFQTASCPATWSHCRRSPPRTRPRCKSASSRGSHPSRNCCSLCSQSGKSCCSKTKYLN